MKKTTKNTPHKVLTINYVTKPVRKVNNMLLDTVIEVILPDNGYTEFLQRVAAVERQAKETGDKILAPMAAFVYRDARDAAKKNGFGVFYVDAFSIGLYVILMKEYLSIKRDDAFAHFMIDLLTDHCNRQIPLEEQDQLARAIGI